MITAGFLGGYRGVILFPAHRVKAASAAKQMQTLTPPQFFVIPQRSEGICLRAKGPPHTSLGRKPQVSITPYKER